MRSLPLFLATGALAMFAAGCGGDDEETTATTGDTASDARGYAETGEAVSDICRRVNADAKKLVADLTGEAKNDAPIVTELVEVTETYVDELKAIEPDPKLKETFDQYVAAVEDNQARSREVAKAAESGDSEAYRMAAEAADAENAKTDPLERALGAKGCETTD
jgi:hypothetical protein